jgi:hypothetical protein
MSTQMDGWMMDGLKRGSRAEPERNERRGGTDACLTSSPSPRAVSFFNVSLALGSGVVCRGFLGDYYLDTVHLRACHVRCLLGFTSIVYANPAAIAIGRVVRVGGVRACAQSSNALAAALLSLRRYEA